MCPIGSGQEPARLIVPHSSFLTWNVFFASSSCDHPSNNYSILPGGEARKTRLSGSGTPIQGAKADPWSWLQKLQTVLSNRSQCLLLSQLCPPPTSPGERQHHNPPNTGHHVGRTSSGPRQRGEGEEHSRSAAGDHPHAHCWRRNCESPVLCHSYVSRVLRSGGDGRGGDCPRSRSSAMGHWQLWGTPPVWPICFTAH